MKKHIRLTALLLTVLLTAGTCSPIRADAAKAKAKTAAQIAAEEEAAAAKEAERQEYYQKPIESNAIENWPQGPNIYADAAIVMEAQTGTILYSKDIYKAEYPASITKILTALITVENCDMDEIVTYSHWATHSLEAGSSSIGTKEGEELTVEQSLYALMLASANECANGLAEHVAGDIDSFVEMMNQKAEELGCVNSHFMDAHGLHDDNHYTCPYDMALIVKAAMQNETFRTIAGTAKYTLGPTNKDDEPVYMINHHFMIGPYKSVTRYLDDTVIAGKTGYTSKALNTLVTVAQRNGMDLIVVTMRSHSTNETGVPTVTDTALLLDYASENFRKLNIANSENGFTVRAAGTFAAKSSVFGSSVPVTKLDEKDTIILPADSAFEDADPKLQFVQDDADPNLIASLSYTYSGVPVGSTVIRMEQTESDVFTFDKESDEKSTSKDSGIITHKGEKTYVRINLRIVLPVVLGVLLLLIIILVYRRATRRARMRRKRYRKTRSDIRQEKKLRRQNAKKGSGRRRRRRRRL